MKDTDLKFMLDSFPEKFKCDVEFIVSKLKYDRFNFHESAESIIMENERIRLPYRIYYQEFSDLELKKFTDVQARLINCYFTRHHNGYVRQRSLKMLLNSRKIMNWEVPYIFALCGEYVVEIVEDIYSNFNIIDNDDIIKFVKLNPSFTMLTEGRIASYWGEYYRTYSSKKDYNGFKLQKYFKSIRKGQNAGK
jgi:hypothetical protein